MSQNPYCLTISDRLKQLNRELTKAQLKLKRNMVAERILKARIDELKNIFAVNGKIFTTKTK